MPGKPKKSQNPRQRARREPIFLKSKPISKAGLFGMLPEHPKGRVYTLSEISLIDKAGRFGGRLIKEYLKGAELPLETRRVKPLGGRARRSAKTNSRQWHRPVRLSGRQLKWVVKIMRHRLSGVVYR